MAQKAYCLYNTGNIEGDQQLAVEIGKTYLALALGTAERLAGFEYYDTADNDPGELLDQIKENSQLLDGPYSQAKLFYNVAEAVLIPVGQFSTSVASEFVDAAFGGKPSSIVNVENVNVQPGIVNVYRSDESWQQAIRHYFRAVSKRHLFSKLIENAPADQFHVQFYKEEMVVVATKDKHLQLARSFEFSGDDDIVYHLLNSCKQTGIDPANTILGIEGFIDTGSKAVQVLKKYFKQVKPMAPAQGFIADDIHSEYPLHYFTPFFKLLS
jgi:hypothetical protein